MSNFAQLPGTGSAFRRAGIRHVAGIADEVLRDAAPFLAAEGIGLNNPSTYTTASLNAALARITERQNLELFTAVGTQRDDARSVLRTAASKLDDNDIAAVTALIDSVEPDPADTRSASVAQVIGTGLGLLDEWSGNPVAAPFLARSGNPPWSDRAARAAADILELARGGRAFAGLKSLIVTHGGLAVLEGTVLAVGGTVLLWADHEDEDVEETAAREIG